MGKTRVAHVACIEEISKANVVGKRYGGGPSPSRFDVRSGDCISAATAINQLKLSVVLLSTFMQIYK